LLDFTVVSNDDDSLLRLWRYINHLLTYLFIYLLTDLQVRSTRWLYGENGCGNLLQSHWEGRARPRSPFWLRLWSL